MTTSAGSLDIIVTADIASAVSSFDKVGAASERSGQRMAKAQEATTKEGTRFIAMVQKQVDTFGQSGTALLAYEARIKGVAAQVNPLISDLERLTKARADAAAKVASDAEEVQAQRSGMALKLQSLNAEVKARQAAIAERIASEEKAAAAEQAAQRTSMALKLQGLNAEVKARQAAIALRISDERKAQAEELSAVKAGQSLKLQTLNAEIKARQAANQARINDEKRSAANITGGGSGAMFGEAIHGAEQGGTATAGFTRELIVLAHELSQGQYKRFGGSLLVLAEYSQTATKALGYLVGPLGIVAGAVGLMTLAIIHGHSESEELRKSLILTGNYAGITEGRFNALSKELAGSTGASIGSTRDALQALVATGEIGPRVLGPLAKAVTLYAKATGDAEDAVAKDFAQMGSGVAKWAAEHNKQMNFLTMAQYEYIKRLEEQGKAEEAQLVIAAALTAHFRDVMKPNLGLLESAIKSAGKAWDSFWDSAKSVGRAETVQEKIAAQIKRLAELDGGPRGQRRPDSEPVGRGRTLGNQRQSIVANIQALGMEAIAQERLAVATAETAKAQKKGIESSDYFTKLDEERKGATRLTKDLEKLNTERENRFAAGGPENTPEDKAREAFIRRRDRTPEDKKAEEEAKRIADMKRRLIDEDEKKLEVIKDQIEQYNNLNKVVDKSELVQRKALLATKDGKAYLKEEVTASLASAAALDAESAARDKAHEAATKRIQDEERIRSAKVALNDFIAKAQINADAELESIRDSTKALGLNTLELQQHNAARAIQKALDIELSKARFAGVGTGQAEAAGAKQITAEKEALADRYNAQREFSFGASRAFKQYQDDAANAAKFAEHFINGSINQMTDALVNFAKTGKLSFGSLFGFMAEEYLRQMLRMSVASVLPGGAGLGSIFGALGGLFGGGAAAAVAGAGSIYAAPTAGVRLATGTNYVPYDGMPAILHKGEAVVPAAYNPAAGGGGSGGGGTSISIGSGQVINIGQGVSRGEVTSAINAANRQSEARIQRGMRQGSFA